MIPFQESQFNMKQILCGLTLLVIIPILSCRGTIESSAPAGARGGRLVTAQIAGPKTFNPLFADDSDTITVSNCMQAPLVRINRKTQQTEPELAESAQFSPDGRVFTVRLRPNLQFSDGHPLTADDVVFTFQVIYDPHIPSGVADTLNAPSTSPFLSRMPGLSACSIQCRCCPSTSWSQSTGRGSFKRPGDWPHRRRNW
jgi:peptide/nickel transport system substrate-binding protein